VVAGRPSAKKKFLKRRLLFQPVKKVAKPHRLASQAPKKSFLAAGCAPGPKKTIFQEREVQPGTPRQFFRSGKSSRAPQDNFSGAGSPAGAL
jgi:hypothetical protein